MTRSGRPRRSSMPLTIFAVMAALLFLLGGLLVLIPGSGDDSNGEPETSAEIRVTPGAEVARLQTAVAENPDDVDSMVVLAEVLANSGRAREAIPWFELAIRARPEDAALRLAFGRVLVRSNNTFDAEIQLKRALELDPENNVAAFYLGQLHEEATPARTSSARDWYERAVEIDPDSVIAEQARERIEALDDRTDSTPVP